MEIYILKGILVIVLGLLALYGDEDSSKPNSQKPVAPSEVCQPTSDAHFVCDPGKLKQNSNELAGM